MTIDHTAKALEYLDVAANTHDLQLKQIALTNAQVHATLAVDKQARIANLFAALSSHPLTDEGWYSSASATVIARIEARNEIRAAIREGLGI
jgi:hypothetical protein